MPIMLPEVSGPSSNVATVQYPGLDENGHTPGDIACFNDPNCDQNKRLIELLGQDINGTGAGWLPDMTPPNNGSGIPSWAYLLGAVGIGWLVLERTAR